MRHQPFLKFRHKRIGCYIRIHAFDATLYDIPHFRNFDKEIIWNIRLDLKGKATRLAIPKLIDCLPNMRHIKIYFLYVRKKWHTMTFLILRNILPHNQSTVNTNIWPRTLSFEKKNLRIGKQKYQFRLMNNRTNTIQNNNSPFWYNAFHFENFNRKLHNETSRDWIIEWYWFNLAVTCSILFHRNVRTVSTSVTFISRYDCANSAQHDFNLIHRRNLNARNDCQTDQIWSTSVCVVRTFNTHTITLVTSNVHEDKRSR